MPCSTLLLADFEACGRIRSTFSGQKRSRRTKTRVTRKLASSRVGTMITSCSYTRISANRNRHGPLNHSASLRHTDRHVCLSWHAVCSSQVNTEQGVWWPDSPKSSSSISSDKNSPQIVSPCWQRKSASDAEDILAHVKKRLRNILFTQTISTCLLL